MLYYNFQYKIYVSLVCLFPLTSHLAICLVHFIKNLTFKLG